MRQQAQRPALPVRLPILFVVVLLGAVGLSIVPLMSSHATANPVVSRGVCRPCLSPGTPLHPSPVGIPAIHARGDLAASSGPWFTPADVAQYVSTHQIGDAAPRSVTTVVSVEFLSSQAVSARLDGESTGVPDNTLLCYVQIKGTFVTTSPPPVLKTVVAHDGVLIFDAHSGNLLMSSVG